MQTIKTAVVVVLLLGVCYGAYVAMNAPEPTLPPDLEAWNENEMGLSVETGSMVDVPQLSPSPPPADLVPLAPPALSPPPAAQVAPPLAAPPSLSLDTPPMAEFPGDLQAKKGDSLRNKLLPDSSTPELPEGTSVPLPGALDSNTNKLDGGLADGAGSGLSLPPMPELPGFDSPTSTPADPSADLPSPPIALLSPNSANDSTAQPNNTAPNNAAPNDPKGSKTAMPYAMARTQALQLTEENKLKAALELMSPYFDHITLEETEHRDLRGLLDALAAEVIYSKRHLIENRFVVSPGETLESIANKFRVSPETLASINRLDGTKIVLPGTELKVFNGPFRAEVDLSRGELVMYLGELYAGIFPVTLGNTPKPELGKFTIAEKRRDKSYTTDKLYVLEPSDPRNPYGGYWMHLGKDICIHGTSDISDPALKDACCISLAPLDAREVYALLGQGSEVVIKE